MFSTTLVPVLADSIIELANSELIGLCTGSVDGYDNIYEMDQRWVQYNVSGGLLTVGSPGQLNKMVTDENGTRTNHGWIPVSGLYKPDIVFNDDVVYHVSRVAFESALHWLQADFMSSSSEFAGSQVKIERICNTGIVLALQTPTETQRFLTSAVSGISSNDDNGKNNVTTFELHIS